ncbi:hypothetical protein O1L44_28470 [Streptomyces noursei]|nr:hypothetical protein [Streptomyces noursei]
MPDWRTAARRRAGGGPDAGRAHRGHFLDHFAAAGRSPDGPAPMPDLGTEILDGLRAPATPSRGGW